MYAPNSNGIIGDVARAASPELAYRIGQYFKNNKTLNQLDNGNRPEEQSANHLLAHAVLGAAVSYATGNDITTGALSGAGSEVAAPVLANYLYGTKDPEELNQEQKDTITSILSLAIAATTYGATGDVGSALSAGEVGKVGIEGNAYVPLSAMQGKSRSEVKRLYDSNISYFNANCIQTSANCNSIVDNMIKFAGSGYVALNYPDLRDRTIILLRDNPAVLERYFNNKVAQFNAKDRSILNMYLLPALEVAGGVAGAGGSIAGTTYACAQTAGFGCYAAAVAGSAGFTSSVDHIVTGSGNIGRPLSQQDPTAFVKFLKSQGLSEATATNLQLAIDVFGTGGVGRVAGSATSGKPIIASGNSVQKIIFNGVELHPSLPPPIAGYNYQPHKLNGKTTAQQNAHINGYRAEIEQANRVANMPNEQVIKWGDKIGNHGADIISVNRITGGVTLWDSKYRSATTNINTSPTFTNPSALQNAKNEAIEAIRNSNLPQSTKNLAISNIVNNNISFKTTGAGNARNSVID